MTLDGQQGSLRIAFLQDGARRHYAVPRALHREGLLSRLFADTVIPSGSALHHAARALQQLGNRRASRLLERTIPEIPDALLCQNLSLRLFLESARPLFDSRQRFHRWESHRIGAWVKRTGLGTANAFHGFIRNMDPDLVRWCKRQGKHTFGDQIIAPAASERLEQRTQQERWKGWEAEEPLRFYDAIQKREEDTWSALDHIVCPSEYVAAELARVGIHNTSVHPNPIDVDAKEPSPRPEARRLTVGFIGTVNLRKGAPYFLEVARRLAQRMKFVMVGPVLVSLEAQNLLRQHVELVGHVPRSAARHWLSTLDVLLFPSTCEGCAGVTQEALASGVPVITSPNAGSVVRHGQDGYVFPYTALDEYVEALATLDDDRGRLEAMRRSAWKRAQSFTIAAYGNRLRHALLAAADPTRAVDSERTAV